MTKSFIRPSFLLAFTLALALSAPRGFAEDAAPASPAPAASSDKQAAAKIADKPAEKAAAKTAAKDETPLTDPETAQAKAAKEQAQKAYGEIKEIATGLQPNDQKHFYLIYSNHNLISTVKMVRGDVDNAVQACGKANPDMKNGMDARFKIWKEAVDPVVKEADGNLSNMIATQQYAPPAKIKGIFKTLDDVRDKTARHVEKTPVTTPEACKYLQGKLDDTQKSLVEALKGTLISYARAFPPDAIPAKPPQDKSAPDKPQAEKPADKPANAPADKSAKAQ